MRENGKEQSAEYFPKNSTTKNYGAVLVKVKEKPTHAIGLKSVTRSKIQATYEGKTQEVICHDEVLRSLLHRYKFRFREAKFRYFTNAEFTST